MSTVFAVEFRDGIESSGQPFIKGNYFEDKEDARLDAWELAHRIVHERRFWPNLSFDHSGYRVIFNREDYGPLIICTVYVRYAYPKGEFYFEGDLPPLPPCPS